MMRSLLARSFCVGVVCMGAASFTVRGETVGLWRFDTIADLDDANDVGETALDDSGNDLHFTKQVVGGHLRISSDVPPLAPPGSLSVDFISAASVDTPQTELLSLGRTGEITVEFWYKPLLTDTLRTILAQENDIPTGPHWSLVQRLPNPFPGNASQVQFSTVIPNQTQPLIRSNDSILDQGDNQWMHLAFTVDDTGTARMYRDGVLLDLHVGGTAQSGFGPYDAFLSTLRLGSQNPVGGFVGTFRMDDLRISDVALLPGAGTGNGELAYNVSLSQAPDPDRPADFGKHWVRQNDFTISAWGFTNYPDLYTGANFNASFSGSYVATSAAGVTPMFLGALTKLDDAARTKVQIALSGGAKAFLLRDELPPHLILGTRNVADYVRSVDDEALIIVGLGGSSASYIDQVMAGVDPDAVIHGFYPFQGPDETTDDWYLGGISDVAAVRERALFHDVPYFAYIQSFDDQIASANPPHNRRRLPNASQLRAELFSKLSAGIKGFAYFVFQDGINEDIALVSPGGVTSSLYAPAAEANLEVAHIGRSLRFLESTDWRFQSGGVAPTPALISPWDPGAGNGLIDAIAIQGAPQDRRDALVGYFADDDGGDYFMLVNTFHGDGLDAAAAAVSFTVTFDDTVDRLWRLNRLTGEVEQIVLVNHVLNLNLPGGTGDLFKFGDGDFAGLLQLLLGDANNDNLVTGLDLIAVQQNFGAAEAADPPTGGLPGDANDDGLVTGLDLITVQQNFGASLAAAGSPAPEPSTGCVAAALLGLLFSARRSVDFGRASL